MTRLSNPTRTLTIEKMWLREINKRWREFSDVIFRSLKEANKSAQITNRAPEPFAMNPVQIRTYMIFMQAQIDEILLGVQIGVEINWQARYQLQSYERSVAASRSALRAQGATLVPTAAEQAVAAGLTPFSIAPSLATTSAGTFPPIHADALQFLFERSFEKLEGWTDNLAAETRQILFDGANQGQGIAEVTRNIRDRIGVSKSRAEVIARTETIQAFQVAQTKEAERASEELDEEILLRWLTARDGRVRHQHAIWHGTLATPEENAKRITVSPWNCRCAQAPVIEEANTPAKTAKFKAERKALLKLESTQAGRRAA